MPRQWLEGMQFLLDANVRFSVGRYLEGQGHTVRYLAGTPEHGFEDKAVLALAYQEDRILITNDKDFGKLIFFYREPHHGVIFFRLSLETSAHYLERLQATLQQYGERLIDHFLVITDEHIRFRSALQSGQ